MVLSDMRAVVTAGAGGIGEAIARRLAVDGARVVAADIDEGRLAALAGEHGRIVAVACDMADAAAVSAMIRHAADAFGGLDVLVNNAGVPGPTGPAGTIGLQAWRRTLAINLDAAFAATEAAIPHLIASGGGSIVNIASAAVSRGGYPGRLPYATSKAALLGMTDTLAMELGTHGIRVNAVLPGTVGGPRLDAVIAARAAATGRPAHELRAEALRSSSMRREIDAGEVADLVAFLCSDAGRSISGQRIGVCGNFEGHRS